MSDPDSSSVMASSGASPPSSVKPIPAQILEPSSKTKPKSSLKVRKPSGKANPNRRKTKIANPVPKKEGKALPTERALEYTDKFLRFLRPLTLYVTLLGGSLFKQVTRKDGTGRFVFNPRSIRTLIFFLIAIFNGGIFVVLTIGLITIFLFPDKKYVDRCPYTWEETMINRHIVQITLAWTMTALSALSGWYVLLQAKSYSNFLNYWMKTIERMDMEVTSGSWRYGWLGCIDTFVLAGYLTFLFFHPGTQGVNDASAFIIQAMLRNFRSRIYEETIGHTDKFCGEYESAYFRHSLAGFCIQIYSILAARCFINQFQFFAKLLSNAAKIWNNRLDCALAVVPEDDEDPNKRRLTYSRILSDHITIVQLFKLTENTFRKVLQCFFGLTTFAMYVQAYYITRVGAPPCDHEQFRELYEGDPKCVMQLRNSEMMDIFNKPTSFKQCSRNLQANVESASISTSIICYTLLSFSSATLAGSLAYLVAMKGFRVIRRHSYADCKSRKQRNFVHSLQCSFASVNPLRLAAGGYFQIEKPLFIIVGMSVMNYFIILLQFRPAQLSVNCTGPVLASPQDLKTSS